MRAKDIKTGVLYAYRPSKRHQPFAVMVVDLRVHAQDRSRPRIDNGPGPVWRFMDNPHIKPGGALYDDTHFGFPAAATHQSAALRGMNDPVGDIADLKSVTYDHVMSTMARDDFRKVIPGTTVYPMVVNPTFVVGEWEEVTERLAAEAELDANLAAIETARKQDLTDAKQQRIDALRSLNLPGTLDDATAVDSYSWSERSIDKVTLTLTQVDALLALLPDGATVPVLPDEPGDEWEYPEGKR